MDQKDFASLLEWLRRLTTNRKAEQPRTYILSDVNISEFSNRWNRLALEYAEQRRSLNGTIFMFRFVRSSGDLIQNINMTPPIAVTLSDTMDRWNRLALKYVRNKKEEGAKEQPTLP